MSTSRNSIVLAIICTVLVTAAQICMKTGLNTGKPLEQLIFDPFLLGGVGLMVMGGFLLTIALKNGELSVIHPLMSLGFVWVVIVSSSIGEVVTFVQYAGIASIVLGVTCISQSRRRA